MKKIYELLRNQQRTWRGGQSSSSEGTMHTQLWESRPKITGVKLVAVIQKKASSTIGVTWDAWRN